MTRTAAWLAVVVLGVGLAHTAGAQPRRGGDGGAAPADRRHGAADRREQIKQKIRAIRDSKLTEALVLDEPTAGRLFPVLARYDDETDKLLDKRIDVQRRLRRVYSLKDTRAVERLLDEAVANQRGFWDLEDKRIAELRKVLTPVQTAKLLVVLPELERKIQNQLRKAIVKRHRADRAGPEVETDIDDDQEPDEMPPEPAPQPPPRRREAPLAPRGNPSNAPGNTPPCDPNTQPCR
jgi:hypothetical protein